MVVTKELQMEAHRKIDTLSDDDIKLIITIIDKIKPSSSVSKTDDKKKKILEMAGKYDFDEEAVDQLRMGSLI